MTVRTEAPRSVAARPTWKAVAIPSEHGGWGLTGEPIALGLLLVFSWAGAAIGAAAMLAFLA
ncbi:MAG TPA: YwiC-like family protein, partial [Ilumatobacteraceae bacterium]|nr:YwiC-like family protein [Ilumatobacteraceae bacterium]